MARRLLHAFAGAALALSLSPAGLHADVVPLYGFLPLQAGRSVTYRYEANQSGPSETGNVRMTVTLTRVAPDELTVKLSPEKPSITVLISGDGSLHPFAQRVLGTPASPSPTPTATPRLKRGQLEPFTSVTPQARPTPHGDAIPDPLSEVASMLSVVGAEGSFPRIWTYVLGEGGVEYRLSVSRTDNGATTMFVADGGGLGNSIHVEATIRNGAFSGAHGTLKVAAADVDYPQTTTIWTLTPSL